SFYWPYIHMDFEAPVNVENTPYLSLDVAATSNWNIHIAYTDKTGTRQTITVSEILGNGTNDFAACDRTVMTADFGAYVREKGHADANNAVTIVGVDYYAIGTDGQYFNLFTCAITDGGTSGGEEEMPTAITSDIYTIQNGLIGYLRAGLTVDTLLGGMNDASWLRVVDADGNAATGAAATGMRVQLTDGVTVIDEVTLSVVGDINGDGAANSSDVRGVLMVCSDAYPTLTAAQTAAVDIDGNGLITTFDARLHLLGAAA
ncbi:MAG: hypothetical protein IJC52_05370, partial [Clostridia bacterium]|nr:hypothetical protein [Clostridia bacterium]